MLSCSLSPSGLESLISLHPLSPHKSAISNCYFQAFSLVLKAAVLKYPQPLARLPRRLPCAGPSSLPGLEGDNREKEGDLFAWASDDITSSQLEIGLGGRRKGATFLLGHCLQRLHSV